MAQHKKVLIIGIDGCRADALAVANTPHLDKLISTGIYSPDGLNDDITISGPGWSAIVCGVWSDKHLVTGNDFTINDYATYPHFFKYVNDHAPDRYLVSICHWGPINDFITLDYADFKLNVSSDAEVANQAQDQLLTDHPDVMFLHFDDVDHAGHSLGFSPDVAGYVAAIEEVDQLVGQVMGAVEQRPTIAQEDWLVLVTTDHGGNGFGHGGTSPQEQRVLVIASGPSVDQSLILRDSAIVSDTTFNCLNDSVMLTFSGIGDYVRIAADSVWNFGADRDFTIECRVRTDISADVAIVGNKDWVTGLNPGFVLSFKFPAGPQWKVNIGDGANRVDINTGGEIANDRWYTLGVSFDRDGLMKMYQDGALIDSADISHIGDITTGEGLFIGTDVNGAFAFSGAIAELRIWDTVLEQEVIGDWYCARPNQSHPAFHQLLGYWKMNEGAGQLQVEDYSVHDNHGAILGPAWTRPEEMVVYDYSLTPRLVDIPVTALTHLCIPVAPLWALDGSSLIEDCVTTGNPAHINIQESIAILPNPTPRMIQMKSDRPQLRNAVVQVYSTTGQLVATVNMTDGEAWLDCSHFESGVYVAIITDGDHVIVKKFVRD